MCGVLREMMQLSAAVHLEVRVVFLKFAETLQKNIIKSIPRIQNSIGIHFASLEKLTLNQYERSKSTLAIFT